MREQKKNQSYAIETGREKIVIVAAERDVVSETIEEALVPRTGSKVALVKST
jgi:hypothetical protein